MKLRGSKTKILKYDTYSDYDKTFLEPSKKFIPKWYRDNNKYTVDKKTFNDKNFKDCVPFLDSFTHGYMITLQGDVFVSQTFEGPVFEWGTVPPLVSERNKKQNEYLPTPQGYTDAHYAWIINGCIRIPKKYSVLMTHPLNHLELPFYTLNGVVDSSILTQGQLPFFLKKDFLGLIPKGTPIVQVIPFKRENWLLKLEKGLWKKSEILRVSSLSYFYGWYRNNFWVKKHYN